MQFIVMFTKWCSFNFLRIYDTRLCGIGIWWKISGNFSHTRNHMYKKLFVL